MDDSIALVFYCIVISETNTNWMHVYNTYLLILLTICHMYEDEGLFQLLASSLPCWLVFGYGIAVSAYGITCSDNWAC